MKTVIGIAGGTASGKSTLCDMLFNELGESITQVIHMDSFFLPEEMRPHVASHTNGRLYIDDNCPETIDWDKFHNALNDAIKSDKPVVIVEGLLVLWDEYTKKKLDIKIFVDCPSDERLIRRIKRNAKWGQSFEKVTDVYLNMVRFRHEQFVEPTKWVADIIVNGAGDNKLLITKTLVNTIKDQHGA